MDPVARNSVVKQGRAHFLLLIWIVLKSWDKTKRLFPDCNDYIPCVSELRTVSRREGGRSDQLSMTRTRCLLAPIYQAAGHQGWVWPRDREERRNSGWDDEERKWSPSPGHSHHQEIYTRNIFSWIYLLLIDNEGHICKECVVIQSERAEMVHLPDTGERRKRTWTELFVNPAVNAE